MKSLVALTLAGAAAAQVSTWGQCGGSGYTGSTTCTSGNTCVYMNQWYSQCQPGTAATSSASPSSHSSTPASSPTSSAAPPSGSSSGTFRYVGRVNPSTKELTWPGTGIAFSFSGTSASIAITVTGTNSADLIVDGGTPIVISSVSGPSISTPSGLSKGTHTVVLRKRSEAYFGSIFIGNVTTDGSLVAATPPTRQIEVIGDSISVGYGLDGTLGCTNSAALEDNPLTYEAVAANSLNADYNVIAWSGKGLTRNYPTGTTDTTPLMPELWTYYGAADGDNTYTFPSSWNPQAVVINLGTNDWAYLNERDPIVNSVFTSAMVSFIQTIEKHYTNANFFLMSSPMLSDSYPTAADAQHTNQSAALKSAITQIGSKAHFVDWPTQGSDVGCDYHPIASTHAAEGAVLASAISSVLGW